MINEENLNSKMMQYGTSRDVNWTKVLRASTKIIHDGRGKYLHYWVCVL